MSRYLCEGFANLAPYVPGEQPRGRRYVKLNTNESPYPPSPQVMAKITAQEIADLRRYSDPDCRDLTDAVAEVYGVAPENVMFGNGSDELLSWAFMTFCDAKHGVCFPDISYGFYQVYAEVYGVPFRKIPLTADFRIRPEDYFQSGNMVVIANPNAPTGLALSREQVESIVANNRDFVVVIDEAYVDFGADSALPLIAKYDNLLAVRTFSKSRSLAGGRLGYAFGCAELINDLRRIKFSTNPYNINRLTLLAGEAAVRDEDYFLSTRAMVMATRTRMQKELTARGFEVLPSSANFLFARSPRMQGGELAKRLRDDGVLVRHFDAPRIADWLRITVGSESEIDSLFTAIDKILPPKEETKND